MRKDSALPAAFLTLALLVALRDLGRSSFMVSAFIVGAVSALGVLAWALDASARALGPRLSKRTSARAFAVTSVLPWSFGLFLVTQGEEVRPWTPLVLAAGGVLALLCVRLLGARLGQLGQTLAATWLLVLTVPLALCHEATGTLVSVRPGTESLHLGLFVATAGLVSLTALAHALAPEPSLRARVALVAAALLGVGCLEVDRRLLVGLYPSVHALIGAGGLLLAAASLVALYTHVRLPRLALRLAVAAELVVAVAFVVLAPRLLDPVLRARLHGLSLGATLLELLPAQQTTVVGAAMHPALGYRRHFDAKPLERRPNILLITVDALRADALGEMKTVTAIAQDGARFTRAYAQGTRTAIGMGTLLTGRYSATMDWRLWAYTRGRVVEYDRMSRDEKQALGKRTLFTTVPQVPVGDLLAERLHDIGYQTSAVPFAGKNEFFRGDLVFARGFDRFVDLTEKGWVAPTSSKLAELSTATLAEFDRAPWFHWVHFYDPHESKKDEAKYRDYVRLVDTSVSEIVEAVRASGGWENTAFVLTADHGEAFGEHSHGGHGTSLYEEQVRVPLVIRIPGLAPGVFDEPVAAIDATATLAQMTGASVEDLDGTSLLPRLRGDVSAESRPVFIELHRYMSNKGEVTHDIKGVVQGELKLIWDRKSGTLEFFDLAEDPGELRNRVAEHPQAADLEALLRSFVTHAETEHPLPRAGAD